MLAINAELYAFIFLAVKTRLMKNEITKCSNAFILAH
jgi:hypothetical protein